MKFFLAALILSLPAAAFCQQETFDLVSFTPPKGWKKLVGENLQHFTAEDKQKRTWARVTLIKSTTSLGTPAADFDSEWNQFAVKPYKLSAQPLGIDTQTVNGWKVRTGLGKFLFNKDTVAMLVNTFSNGERCFSLLLQSNTTSYGPAMDLFLASVTVPNATASGNGTIGNNVHPTATKPAPEGFTYNTTNFDDGWTAVAKEDWVELTKGNIKALLHYPRAEDKKYYSQYLEHVSVFWNLLVAPRYTNLRQYQSPGYNHSSEPGLFAAGVLNDNATKKDVWVALFSKGKSGWVEVIAPDKETFVQTFGVNNPDSYFSAWEPLLKLAGKNYFAVGENDLVGKWSNDFTGSTYYYNLYTGLSAGSSTYASRQFYTFRRNKTYNWNLAVGQGGTGTTMKVNQAEASGTWKMLNNWQIWCSEIERRPVTYNAYFSCIRGGRILWLQDVSYGGYTAFGKVGN